MGAAAPGCGSWATGAGRRWSAVRAGRPAPSRSARRRDEPGDGGPRWTRSGATLRVRAGGQRWDGQPAPATRTRSISRRLTSRGARPGMVVMVSRRIASDDRPTSPRGARRQQPWGEVDRHVAARRANGRFLGDLSGLIDQFICAAPIALRAACTVRPGNPRIAGCHRRQTLGRSAVLRRHRPAGHACTGGPHAGGPGTRGGTRRLGTSLGRLLDRMIGPRRADSLARCALTHRAGDRSAVAPGTGRRGRRSGNWCAPNCAGWGPAIRKRRPRTWSASATVWSSTGWSGCVRSSCRRRARRRVSRNWARRPQLSTRIFGC